MRQLRGFNSNAGAAYAKIAGETRQDALKSIDSAFEGLGSEIDDQFKSSVAEVNKETMNEVRGLQGADALDTDAKNAFLANLSRHADVGKASGAFDTRSQEVQQGIERDLNIQGMEAKTAEEKLLHLDNVKNSKLYDPTQMIKSVEAEHRVAFKDELNVELADADTQEEIDQIQSNVANSSVANKSEFMEDVKLRKQFVGRKDMYKELTSPETIKSFVNKAGSVVDGVQAYKRDLETRALELDLKPETINALVNKAGMLEEEQSILRGDIPGALAATQLNAQIAMDQLNMVRDERLKDDSYKKDMPMMTDPRTIMTDGVKSQSEIAKLLDENVSDTAAMDIYNKLSEALDGAVPKATFEAAASMALHETNWIESFFEMQPSSGELDDMIASLKIEGSARGNEEKYQNFINKRLKDKAQYTQAAANIQSKLSTRTGELKKRNFLGESSQGLEPVVYSSFGVQHVDSNKSATPTTVEASNTITTNENEAEKGLAKKGKADTTSVDPITAAANAKPVSKAEVKTSNKTLFNDKEVFAEAGPSGKHAYSPETLARNKKVSAIRKEVVKKREAATKAAKAEVAKRPAYTYKEMKDLGLGNAGGKTLNQLAVSFETGVPIARFSSELSSDISPQAESTLYAIGTKVGLERKDVSPTMMKKFFNTGTSGSTKVDEAYSKFFTDLAKQHNK